MKNIKRSIMIFGAVAITLLMIFSIISVNASARHITTSGRTYGEVDVMGLRFFKSALIIKITSGGSIDIGASHYTSGTFLVGFFIGKVHGYDPTYPGGMPSGQFEIDGQGIGILKTG